MRVRGKERKENEISAPTQNGKARVKLGSTHSSLSKVWMNRLQGKKEKKQKNRLGFC